MTESLYGLLAEFADPEALVHAARETRAAGYRRFDAYSPMPVEGLADAIGFTRTRMPLVILLGGIIGGCSGYGLQYWVATIAYPLNIGGRPLNSWPAFIPITFETTILGAALFGVFGMLALNGLPRPHHPLFGAPNFTRASRDGFFLCIEAQDPRFHLNQTRQFLSEIGAVEVSDVPL
ncbi:MAG TPA: DUF3341 domain-containing protein [Pirellulales bacterium]